MIIFDLDGTLADCEHRRHFVEKFHYNNLRGMTFDDKDSLLIKSDHTFEILNREDRPNWKPDWKQFYKSCDKDLPIQPVIDILEYIGEGKEYGSDTPWVDYSGIEIWSGRCESVRKKTEKWLSNHIRHDTSSGIELKMRPIGDTTPDDQLKEKWLDESIAEGKKIEFVFDDRPKVVRMWRRRGIFVFDVNQTGKEF